MPHTLPPLPYAPGALEPHLSRETLKFHHDKHHATYVKKLNELVKGTEFESATLADTVRRSSGSVFNNAAQAWNHDFFWHCLAPKAPRRPAGALGKAIDDAFGSYSEFKEKFSKTALETFGSGWAWLTRGSDGALSVVSTGNAGTPITDGHVPVLTCDVWEHAYYIDYRNQRADYVKAFWHIVDWKFAESNYGNQ